MNRTRFIRNFTSMISEKINIKTIVIIIVGSISLGLIYNGISANGVPLFYQPDQYQKFSSDVASGNEPLLISLEQTIKFHDDPNVMFIDARDQWDFAEGHIKGAINIPEFSFAPDSATSLNKNVKYVIYCGGDDCDISKRMASELKNLGFNALYIYEKGYDEWNGLGLPIE